MGSLARAFGRDEELRSFRMPKGLTFEIIDLFGFVLQK